MKDTFTMKEIKKAYNATAPMSSPLYYKFIRNLLNPPKTKFSVVTTEVGENYYTVEADTIEEATRMAWWYRMKETAENSEVLKTVSLCDEDYTI